MEKGRPKANLPPDNNGPDAPTIPADERQGYDVEDQGGAAEAQRDQDDAAVDADIAKKASSGLPDPQADSVRALINSTAQLAGMEESDPKVVMSKTGNMLNAHYSLGVVQSDRSFYWALVAAGVGVLFFLFALGFLVFTESESLQAATVSAVAGAIVELIAGLSFYLYGKTVEQAASHRASLEEMQRFLLANSLIEALSETKKDESRAKLISELTEDERNDSRDDSRSRKEKKRGKDGSGGGGDGPPDTPG